MSNLEDDRVDYRNRCPIAVTYCARCHDPIDEAIFIGGYAFCDSCGTRLSSNLYTDINRQRRDSILHWWIAEDHDDTWVEWGRASTIEQYCPRCQQTKMVSEFQYEPSSNNGRGRWSSYCKDCKREYDRERRKQRRK